MTWRRYLPLTAIAVFGALAASWAPVSGADRTASDLAIPIVSPPTWDPSLYVGSIGVVNGQLIVGDQGFGDDAPSCRLAVIDPARLRLISNRALSCDNPLVMGARVAPIESIVPKGSPMGQVKISVSSSSGSSFHLSPVVMRYGNYSDGRPEWTYGGGYLWLYDPGTENVSPPPHLSAEVLQISAVTGKVVNTVLMPSLTRLELAADDDGLWLGAGQETTGGGALLYFVGSHSSRVKPIAVSGSYVAWISASGHTAWVDVVRETSSSQSLLIETPDGPTASPTGVVPTGSALPATDLGQAPFDAPSALSVTGVGLVSTQPGWVASVGTGSFSQTVGVLNPTTGRSEVVGSFSSPSKDLLKIEGYVVFERALFVLTSAASASGSDAWLYRVPLG